MLRTKKRKSRINSNAKTREILVGKPEFQLETLDLIEVQKKSWNRFLEISLEKIITEFFPIDDYTGKKFTLHYEGLYFGDSRYPLDVCIRKKLTFDLPVYIKLRIVNKKTRCLLFQSAKNDR